MASCYHYTESGLDYVYLNNGFVIHKTAYGEGVSIHDIDGLHKVIACDIVNNRVKLSGKEVRFLRRELELSQRALGDLLDVTDQTVANWEKENVEIPKSSDVLLRAFYMERTFGRNGVSEIIEAINDTERKIAEIEEEIAALKVNLEEFEQGWRMAA